ncbi:MAG TPA: 16S rRNA (uracil(1498)-N(3))-methyltransferase [Kineosporiaceae bacterium]
MSLPLFVVGPPALRAAEPGSAVVLDGDEGRHAASVRRVRAGERVDVADGAGRVARCLVDRAERDRLMLTVEAVRDVSPRLPRLVLVQALAKGGRDEFAVETATEFGVDAVVPWQAARSIVRWEGGPADRGDRGRRRWEATALAAAKQSRRPAVPAVEPLVTTAGLAQRAAAGECVLVLHEDAVHPLSTTPLPGDAVSILLAVGPEGGIGGDELTALTAAGARPVRLGPEVLRSSSAGPAALAVLSVRLGRW